jgi:putative flippase GtrA
MKSKITASYISHKTDVILFAMSGLLAFVVDFSTLQLVDKLISNLMVATISGIAAGFAVSYSLNMLRFNRRHSNVRKPKESLPLFIALFVVNSVFTFWCLDFNESHANYPRILIKVATVSCIMVWNYLLFHYIVFRKKEEK